MKEKPEDCPPVIQSKERRVIGICGGDSDMEKFYVSYIADRFGDTYELVIQAAGHGYAHELSELVDKCKIDLLILVLENIIFRGDNQNRYKKAVNLVRQINEEYGMPIIAMSAVKEDAFINEENVKSAGASYFAEIPCNFEKFGEAVKVCLSKKLGYKDHVITRKGKWELVNLDGELNWRKDGYFDRKADPYIVPDRKQGILSLF